MLAFYETHNKSGEAGTQGTRHEEKTVDTINNVHLYRSTRLGVHEGDERTKTCLDREKTSPDKDFINLGVF